MEIIHDRRSGFDRRHRFLNGLDRRMSPPPPLASVDELDNALGTSAAEEKPPIDGARASAYWGGEGEDAPPVE